jgi:heterodisulfide reductase subunit C
MTATAANEIASRDFSSVITEMSGQPISRCYQCAKCSAGCPVSKWYEWSNHGIIRKIQLGAREELLNSHALWLCVGCETCGERCPNSINIARLMDAMRQVARSEKVAPAEPAVGAFHSSFLASVQRFGRVHELTMLMEYKVKTRDFFTDVGAGLILFFKGKIPIMPTSIKEKKGLGRIFALAKANGQNRKVRED